MSGAVGPTVDAAAGGDAGGAPDSRRVLFMATCLCDAFFDDVARAAVEVLEQAGCTVEFPEGQTCCGQPAFNLGDFETSKKVVRHGLEVFAGELPVVTPSGSCAAMNLHGAPLEFEGEPEGDRARVDQLAARTFELCDFLVNQLGVATWTGRFPKKVAYHHACHTRGSGSGAAALALLRSIEGLELLEFGEAEQCCGFGGTFSVTFPHISKSMGQVKIDNVLGTDPAPDVLLSGDMSCLMHLHGLAEKAGRDLPVMHVAQVLAAAGEGG